MVEYSSTLSIEDMLENHIDTHITAAQEAQYEQLHAHGSEAYHYVKHITAANVPIAAAQEPRAFTSRMLQLFMRQSTLRDVKPFALSISANYPTVENETYEQNVQENIQTLRKFNQYAGHAFPFSYYEQPYTPDTTIGAIRQDLLNASLLHIQHRYRYSRIPQYANLLIADVDTSYMSNGYMARPQAIIEEGYSYSVANKRYSTSNGMYPELDRAISAINLSHLISPTASYDCHALYALPVVFAGEGFDSTDSIAETHYMRRRALDVMGSNFVAPTAVQAPGAIAVSPPRRPFEKFRNGLLAYELWEPGKFGMQDAYREGIVSSNEDISKTMANLIVAHAVNTITVYVRDSLISNICDEQGDIPYAVARRAVEAHIKRILEVADVLLDLRINDLSFFDTVSSPLEQLP